MHVLLQVWTFMTRECARARFIASARVYNLCVRIYARILMKFLIVDFQCIFHIPLFLKAFRDG